MRVWIVLLIFMLAGCASAPPPIAPTAREGINGLIRWKVEDIREERVPESSEIRWHYTLILTNTGAETIDFKREEIAIYLNNELIGGVVDRRIDARLVGGGERRLQFWQGVHLRAGVQASGIPTEGGFQSANRYGNFSALTIWRWIYGDARFGKPVMVDIRFSP